MTFWHTAVLIGGAAAFLVALVVVASAGSLLAQWSRRERASSQV
ncbi:hypothetical protein [Cellulomonas fimi]|nr:hypothetical protein [Cellulomonas fimi]